MTRTVGNVIAFFVTFALGSVVTYFVILQASKLADFVIPELAEVEVESPPAPEIVQIDPPLFNPNVNYTDSLKVKLLQTGAYHSDEVPYKTGERWLGLFRKGNRYELRWTTIENRAIDDPLFDRGISISSPQESIFLLKNADSLQPGPVETLLDNVDGDSPFDLTSGKSFGLRGSFWWLGLEKGDENGYPTKGSSLVLKQTGYDPVFFRTLPNGCNDCSWRLLWVGDLNRDQNLDFLIDVSDHYNVYAPTLFISSSDYGYAVYASFHGVGC